MAAVSYPLRIPAELLALAKLRSKEEYTDQSTAIRQLLYMGAEEYVLELVGSGRISIGRASELLKISVHDVHRIAGKHGLRLGATSEQQRKSAGTVRKILR